MVLALDGHATNFSNSNGVAVAVNLTTTSTNDVIVVLAGLATGTDRDFTSAPTISDVAGLTWTTRANSTGHSYKGAIIEFYAIAASTLSADSITVTPNAADHISVEGFGISGANTGTPFDVNAALPKFDSAAGSLPTGTITTSNANDFIISFNVPRSVNITNHPTGFTTIDINNSPATISIGTAYEIVSSIQTGTSYNWPDSADYILLTDAVQQASAGTAQNTMQFRK